MGTTFNPVTLDLIDEGEFVEAINAELTDLQRVIAVYRRLHGDKAKKAKAKLSIEIELGVENPDDGAYSIKTSMKATHPKRPASISLAIEGEDENDQPTLFVRASGSDRDDPRQSKLSTRDGRTIDPVTGQPYEE